MNHRRAKRRRKERLARYWHKRAKASILGVYIPSLGPHDDMVDAISLSLSYTMQQALGPDKVVLPEDGSYLEQTVITAADFSDKPDMTTLVLDGKPFSVVGAGPSFEQIQEIVDHFKPTPEELERIKEAAQLNPSEVAFNKKMEELGVPSFSQWLNSEKGRGVIAREAEKGKMGAALLLSMLAAQDPPEEK